MNFINLEFRELRCSEIMTEWPSRFSIRPPVLISVTYLTALSFAKKNHNFNLNKWQLRRLTLKWSNALNVRKQNRFFSLVKIRDKIEKIVSGNTFSLYPTMPFTALLIRKQKGKVVEVKNKICWICSRTTESVINTVAAAAAWLDQNEIVRVFLSSRNL